MSYKNLKKHNPKKKPFSINEYPLYTDAEIIGELNEDSIPYRFLNLSSGFSYRNSANESILLRIYWYISANEESYEVKTDTSKYHGGWTPDEMAALASLKLGIRLKAGELTRIFDAVFKDPLGVPQCERAPAPKINFKYRRPVLPSVLKKVNIKSLSVLSSLKSLDEATYIALVRAARQYQSALWLAEEEPELAWLLFISSLETAANHWSSMEASPSQKLKTSKPELSELLIKCGVKSYSDKLQSI